MTNLPVRADDRRIGSKRADVPYWQQKCDEHRTKIANLTASIADAAEEVRAAERSLQPIAIAAYGEADQNALKKLSGFRRDLAEARLDQEAREIALKHVQGQLAEVEGKLAEAQHNVKLRQLSDMAEQRVELAGKVDEHLGNLLATVNQLHDLQGLMFRLISPDLEHLRHYIAFSSRLNVAVTSSDLRDFIPNLRSPSDVVDPRAGKRFADLEKESMGALVLRSEDAAP